jgi:hypothetical protein
MADPLRCLLDWPFAYGRRIVLPVNPALIVRQDPVRQAIRLIARNELRVWFEPDWYIARTLASRFPHCLICSIPVESNTPSLHRIPGWRPRPNNGVV